MTDEIFTARAAKLAGHACWLLGWTPDTFWRATPAELAAVLNAAAGSGAGDGVDTATFEQLKERFPDG